MLDEVVVLVAMYRSSTLGPTLALCATVLAFIGFACSSDSGDDDPGKDESNSQGDVASGSCVLSVACMQASGPAADIALFRNECLSSQASFTAEPCPERADRIGCCVYNYGLDFRECLYPGTKVTHPTEYCADFDGVWSDG